MRLLPLLPLLLPFFTMAQGLDLLPQPVHVEMGEGLLALPEEVPISVLDPNVAQEAAFLASVLSDRGLRARMLPDRSPLKGLFQVFLAKDGELPAEGYLLRIWPDQVELIGADAAGIFHGVQTIIQLLQEDPKGRPALPCAVITDYPRFTWRGLHLDVSRHFFPVEFVKSYIDLLARYKMNSFHWHLTDDQGWRIEIKKYPKLTEVGAWRSGSEYGPYSDRTFDSTRYGGFYTQEQIREVVAYATARHVNVVPEIEMPGHALAALAAYPELSCTGGPFEVQKGWGVFDDVFCPKEETFTFLENVLSEVIALFPSEYIHIGGDECPKTRWKECANCQALMKKEGLKDEHELQSYFTQRIEKFVNSKGRKIIGWDEILEGGLAPNAAVMSWRGTDGGIAAAKQKHNVVMSPGTHCYFDHYQGDPGQEPLAIGGFTTVQKVYSYEPIPDTLTEEEARYILGAQGNLWAEYITTPEHAEYMALPRAIALSEVLWSPKEARDEKDFLRRLELEFPKLDALKVNASKSLYQVSITPIQDVEPGKVLVKLSSGLDLSLSYSVLPPPFDASKGELERYSAPFLIDKDCEVQGWFFNEDRTGPISTRRFTFNLATARPITCDPLPSDRYDDGGPFTLVDGVTAGPRRVNYEWLGWVGKTVTITVDLGEVKNFKTASINGLNETYSWIHAPESVEVGVGDDPESIVLKPALQVAGPSPNRITYTTTSEPRGRYVRFRLSAVKKIPEGFPGAGSAAWMFLDEITVH